MLILSYTEVTNCAARVCDALLVGLVFFDLCLSAANPDRDLNPCPEQLRARRMEEKSKQKQSTKALTNGGKIKTENNEKF